MSINLNHAKIVINVIHSVRVTRRKKMVIPNLLIYVTVSLTFSK